MRKNIILGIIIIVIIALPVIGWYANNYQQSRSYEKAASAANEYITQVLSGDVEAAYSSASDSFKENQTQEEFSESFKTLKTEDPLHGEASVLKSKEGNIVYVQMIDGMPETPEGRTSAQFTLTLSGKGGWKVESVSVN